MTLATPTRRRISRLDSPPSPPPRWGTPRSPERPTFGPAIAAVAQRLGTPLMPWQRYVADVAGELDPDGNPVYRDIGIIVPRQSGKTTLILAWEVHRAIEWARSLGPQRVVYSAQTGNDARKKLLEDQYPVLEARQKALGIRRCLRGMGNESVEWRNGSRLVLLANTEESGHGKTVHLAIKDEKFADKDDRRDQALVPAQATIASAQSIDASTMGTFESVPLNNMVEQGRDLVERDVREGTAYFEWSAPEDVDADDEDAWLRCMPALGHTIGLAAVRHARLKLKLAEFRRAYLDIMDGRQGEPVIPADKWKACERPTAKIPPPHTWAVDVSPDRSSGCIAVGGRDGRGGYGEVVDYRSGTSWIPARAAELKARRGGEWILDAAGPAGSLLSKLKEKGVEPRLVSTREHAQACGGLYNEIIEETFTHIGQAPLNAAVDGADRRQVGDVWLWSRRSSSVDICPLVAVTLARWGAFEPEELTPITEASPGVY